MAARKRGVPETPPDKVELIDGRAVPMRVVVNARARRIGIRLDLAKREVVAIAPTPGHALRAAKFAQDRAGWIGAQLAKLPRRIELTPGESIPFRGEMHLLARVSGRRTARIPEDAPLRIEAGAPDDETFAVRIRRFLVQEARRDLEACVRKHAATLGVTWTRLTVKDTTSRWGSCSSRGALAFSWRVILAPPSVLDYLAAHEVAHLRELNHSHRFWAHVARCFPDFEAAETWLKRHGAALHAVAPRA